MPNTEAIDRNKLDFEDISVLSSDFEIIDLVGDVCETFKNISSLKNRDISSTTVKNLFGHLIKQYDMLEMEQKWNVFVFLSTNFYINPAKLKEKMSQNIFDFESLVKTVNDLRKIIEPEYLWILNKLSTLKGGRDMLKDMKNESLNMILQCEYVSSLQKSAVHEMNEYLNSINIDEHVTFFG